LCAMAEFMRTHSKSIYLFNHIDMYKAKVSML
jgi:hypothetical protein